MVKILGNVMMIFVTSRVCCTCRSPREDSSVSRYDVVSLVMKIVKLCFLSSLYTLYYC